MPWRTSERPYGRERRVGGTLPIPQLQTAESSPSRRIYTLKTPARCHPGPTRHRSQGTLAADSGFPEWSDGRLTGTMCTGHVGDRTCWNMGPAPGIMERVTCTIANSVLNGKSRVREQLAEGDPHCQDTTCRECSFTEGVHGDSGHMSRM